MAWYDGIESTFSDTWDAIRHTFWGYPTQQDQEDLQDMRDQLEEDQKTDAGHPVTGPVKRYLEDKAGQKMQDYVQSHGNIILIVLAGFAFLFMMKD